MEVIGDQAKAYTNLVVEKSHSIGGLESDLKLFKKKLQK
jgi:hypothetical protein